MKLFRIQGNDKKFGRKLEKQKKSKLLPFFGKRLDHYLTDQGSKDAEVI